MSEFGAKSNMEVENHANFKQLSKNHHMKDGNDFYRQ
jgi:hypothetical protein